MKTYILIVTLVISFSAFAQNWALFPTQQGSYYATKSVKEGFDEIQYLAIDSIQTNSSEDIFYINSKFFPESYLKCIPKYSTRLTLPTDSIFIRNDTVFYQNTQNGFYFLPNAKPGESWYIKPLRAIDSIKITYDRIETIDFLSLTDSVKRYSFQAMGINEDSTNINEQVMLLSKHFGLVEYVNFDQLIQAHRLDNFKTSKIAGIETDSLHYGYKLPDLKTFFPYHIEDVLFWEDRSGFYGSLYYTTNFYLDTVIQVVENEDSIYYVYNRTFINDKNEIYDQQSGLIKTSVFADFENIFNIKPSLWGYGNGNISNPIDWNVPIWSVVHLMDDNNNSIVSAYSDHIGIDTTSCSTSFSSLGSSFTFDNKRGLTRERSDVNNENYGVINLLGSKINGVEVGAFDVITSIETQITKPVFQLYPNPAQNYINLVINEIWLSAKYSIVDIEGRLIDEGNLTEQSIPITHLSAGIYFFKMIVNEKVFILKFVKQAF